MKVLSLYIKSIFLLTLFLSSTLYAQAQLKVTTHGSALQINNQNTYAITTDINSSLAEHTLEFWLQTDEKNSSKTFLSLHGANESIKLTSSSEGNLTLIIKDSNANEHNYTTNKIISDGLWHHIAYSLSSTATTTLSVYIDGATTNLTPNDTAYTLSENNLSLQIGSAGNSAIATIDELRLWNIVRAQTDINSTKNSQLSARTNLSLYYNFDERIGGTVWDMSDSKLPLYISTDFTRLNFLDNTPLFNSLARYSINDENNLTTFTQNEDFTISFWLKVPKEQSNTSSTFNYILDKGVGVPTPYAFRIYNQSVSQDLDGYLQVIRSDLSTSAVTKSAQKINDNLWHHIVYTKSGNALTLYVDDQSSTTEADLSSSTVNDLNITIGGSQNSFTGSIREVAIYKKHLNFSERKHLQASVFKTPELTAYWPLNEDTNTTAFERVNALHGISNGDVTTVSNAPKLFGDTLFSSDEISINSRVILLDALNTPSYSILGLLPEQVDFNASLASIKVSLKNEENLSFGVSAVDGADEYNLSVNVMNLHTTPKVNFNLSNINLDEHNITTIKLYDFNDSLSTPLALDLSNELNDTNISVKPLYIFDYSHTYSIALDVNRSNFIDEYLLNRYTLDLLTANSKDTLLTDYQHIFDTTNNIFTIDLTTTNFISESKTHFNFDGNISLLDSNEIHAKIKNANLTTTYFQDENIIYTESNRSSYDLNSSYYHFFKDQVLEYSLYQNAGSKQLEISLAREYNANHDFQNAEYNITLHALSLNVEDSYALSKIVLKSEDGAQISTLFFTGANASEQVIPLVEGSYTITAYYYDGSSAYYNAESNAWVEDSTLQSTFVVNNNYTISAILPMYSPKKPTIALDLTSLLYNENNSTTELLLGENTSEPGIANGVVLSHDGTRAYVAQDSYGVIVYDLNQTNPLKVGSFNLNESSKAHEIAISKDGTRAYVAYGTSGLVVLDITTDAPQFIAKYPTQYAYDVKLSQDGQLAYVADDNAGLLIFEIINDPYLLQTINTGDKAYGVALDASESYAYVANETSGVSVINLSGWYVESNITIPSGNVHDVIVSKDESKLYVADQYGSLQVVDTSTKGVIATDMNVSEPYALEISSDGTTLYVADKALTKGFAQYDITQDKPRLLGIFSTANYSYDLAISDDNRGVIVNANGDILVVDTTLTLTLANTFTSQNFSFFIDDLDYDELNVSIDINDTALLTASPSLYLDLNTSIYANEINTTLSTQTHTPGFTKATINVDDGTHNSVRKTFYIQLEKSYELNTTLNLNNVNLSEHNISNIEIIGFDENNQSYTITDIKDIANGINSFTFPIYLENQSISIRFDVNNSGDLRSYFYNFNSTDLDSELLYSAEKNEYKAVVDSNNPNYTIDVSNQKFYSLLITHFNLSAPNTLLDGYSLNAYMSANYALYAPTVLLDSNNTSVTFSTAFSHADADKNINFVLENSSSYYSELSIFNHLTEAKDTQLYDINISFAQMNITLDSNSTFGFFAVSSDEFYNDLWVVPENTEYSLPIIKNKEYYFVTYYADYNGSIYDGNLGEWVDITESENVAFINVTNDSFSLPTPPSEAPFKPMLKVIDPQLKYFTIFEINESKSGSIMDARKIIFNTDKTFAYVANGTSGLAIIDLNVSQPYIRDEFQFGENNITNVVLSHDNSKLFAADSNNSIYMFNIDNNNSVTYDTALNIGLPFKHIQISENDDYLYISLRDQGLYILELNSSIITSIALPSYTTFFYDSSTLFVATGSSGVYTLDVSDPSSPSLINANSTIFANRVKLNSDRSKAFVSSLDSINILDANSLNILETIFIDGSVKNFALSSDEKELYILNGTETLQIIDLTTYEVRSSFTAQSPLTHVRAFNNNSIYITQTDNINSGKVSQIATKETVIMSNETDSLNITFKINDMNEDNLTIALDSNDSSLITLSPLFNSELNSSEYQDKNLTFTLQNLHAINGGSAKVTITVQDNIHRVVQNILVELEEAPHYIVTGELLNNDKNITHIFLEDANGTNTVAITDNQFAIDIYSTSIYSFGVFINGNEKYYFDGSGFVLEPSGYAINLTSSYDFGQIDIALATFEGLNSRPLLLNNFFDINSSEDFHEYNLTLRVDDVNGDDLNITIDSNDTSIVAVNASFTNQWLTQGEYRDVNLTYSLLSQANAYGLVRISVKVDDGNLTTIQQFDLNVSSVDDPLIFTTLTNLNIVEDSAPLTIELNASDADNEITYSTLSYNPDLLTADLNGSLLTLTPQPNMYGIANIEVNASNGSERISHIFSVNIAGVDDNISFSPLEDTTILEDNSTFYIALNATDIDGGTVTFSVASSDEALVSTEIQYSNSIAYLFITPAANVTGTFTIEVNATSDSSFDSQSFILTVAPVNDTPTILKTYNDFNLSEDFGELNLVTKVSDIEGDNLTITIESNNTDIIKVNNPFNNQLVEKATYESQDLNYSILSVANAYGSVRVTVNVDDGNLSIAKSYTINVIDQPEHHIIEGQLINNDRGVVGVFLQSNTEIKTANLVNNTFSIELNQDGAYYFGILLDGSDQFYYFNGADFVKTRPDAYLDVNDSFNFGQLDVNAYHIEGENISDYLHVSADDLTIYDGQDKNITLSISHDYGQNINIAVEQKSYALFSVEAPKSSILEADYSRGVQLTIKANADHIGSDTLKVFVKDSEGATVTQDININVKKSFTLDVNQSIGQAPLTISMRANVAGTDFQYFRPTFCYFDGNPSASNYYTFQNAGRHEIRCTVTDTENSITKTREVYAYNSDAIKVKIKKGWNSVALPYKMELEESDINKYFGDDRIKTIYKYTPLAWSYWDKKFGIDTTKPVPKFSSLSSKSGLWIQAEEDLTLYFEKSGTITNTPNETAEYLFNGWYFTSFNEDKEITDIVKLVESKGKTIEYIWINQDGVDKVYDPTNKYSGFSNITKIKGKIPRTKPLWIKVK